MIALDLVVLVSSCPRVLVFPGHVADGVQPLCDGNVWGRATNIILYLGFPAEITMSPAGWLAPAEKALQLATSWRLDN